MSRPNGRRYGAYVLAADPTWLASSIVRYYDHLDVLVVAAASDDRGWTGAPILARRCLGIVQSLDTRAIVRVLEGTWTDHEDPMRADTAQRQAALDALAGDVDWVLQIDTDEILPSFDALSRAIDQAESLGLAAVEWPMRVLYRRLSDGGYLEVRAQDGQPCYDYPGPVAVRSGITVDHARRTREPYLRPVVVGDDRSLQVARPHADGEVRAELLTDEEAMVHNSWARDRHAVKSKIRAWGHNQGWRSWRYYYTRWLPSPIRWRRMRDLHPFSGGLWPTLAPSRVDIASLLASSDR